MFAKAHFVYEGEPGGIQCVERGSCINSYGHVISFSGLGRKDLGVICFTFKHIWQ